MKRQQYRKFRNENFEYYNCISLKDYRDQTGSSTNHSKYAGPSSSRRARSVEAVVQASAESSEDTSVDEFRSTMVCCGCDVARAGVLAAVSDLKIVSTRAEDCDGGWKGAGFAAEVVEVAVISGSYGRGRN